jgi:hypothetical protein
MKRNNRNCIECEYTEAKNGTKGKTHDSYLPWFVLDERKEDGVTVSIEQERNEKTKQTKQQNPATRLMAPKVLPLFLRQCQFCRCCVTVMLIVTAVVLTVWQHVVVDDDGWITMTFQ